MHGNGQNWKVNPDTAALDFNELFYMIITVFSKGNKIKCGMAVDSVENLKFLKELFEKRIFKPVVDRIYPLV